MLFEDQDLNSPYDFEQMPDLEDVSYEHLAAEIKRVCQEISVRLENGQKIYLHDPGRRDCNLVMNKTMMQKDIVKKEKEQICKCLMEDGENSISSRLEQFGIIRPKRENPEYINYMKLLYFTYMTEHVVFLDYNRLKEHLLVIPKITGTILKKEKKFNAYCFDFMEAVISRFAEHSEKFEVDEDALEQTQSEEEMLGMIIGQSTRAFLSKLDAVFDIVDYKTCGSSDNIFENYYDYISWKEMVEFQNNIEKNMESLAFNVKGKIPQIPEQLKKTRIYYKNLPGVIDSKIFFKYRMFREEILHFVYNIWEYEQHRLSKDDGLTYMTGRQLFITVMTYLEMDPSERMKNQLVQNPSTLLIVLFEQMMIIKEVRSEEGNEIIASFFYIIVQSAYKQLVFNLAQAVTVDDRVEYLKILLNYVRKI